VLYIYLPPQFVYKVGNTVIECEENRMQELACSHQLASPSPCLKKYRCSVCPNRLQLPRSFYPLTLRERNIHVPRAAVNSHDILQSSTIVTFEEVQRVAQSRSGSPFHYMDPPHAIVRNALFCFFFTLHPFTLGKPTLFRTRAGTSTSECADLGHCTAWCVVMATQTQAQ